MNYFLPSFILLSEGCRRLTGADISHILPTVSHSCAIVLGS